MRTIITGLVLFISAVFGRSPKEILGGRLARIVDHPHQVSIRLFDMHACAGSIIDETHVITCAHCVALDRGVTINIDMEVLSGTNNLFDYEEGQIHKVKMVIPHPEYRKANWENDIAILKLSTPFFFSNTRQPITFPNRKVRSGVLARISGWGTTDLAINRDSEYLQEIVTQVISNERCESLLDTLDINSKHLCTLGFPDNNLADGDSGGSLVYNGQIIGISVAVVHGNGGFPILFTRIFPYLDWIRQTIHKY